MKSKPTKMQSCSCCFEDWIGPCNGPYDSVTINTALTPDATYNWRITDKFGKIYQGETTAENNGTIIIPCSELPDFLFTPYSGTFTIEMLDAGCKPIKILLASEYDCITMAINGGNSDKKSIGCSFPSGTNPTVNGMIPFVNQTQVDIDWSQFINTFGNFPVVQVFQKDDFDPNIYHLVSVEILQVRNVVTGVLVEINIDLGGPMDGYVLLTGNP